MKNLDLIWVAQIADGCALECKSSDRALLAAEAWLEFTYTPEFNEVVAWVWLFRWAELS